MSDKKLYAQGRITAREFRRLRQLDALARNKAVIKRARKEARRIYKEYEREYKKRP